MTYIVFKSTVTSEGVARLLQQFKDTDVQLLIEPLLDEVQELLTASGTYAEKMRLAESYSALLDVWGSRVGESRQGRPDAEYYEAIQARIAINNSDGRGDDLMYFVTFLSATDEITAYEYATGFGFDIHITNLIKYSEALDNAAWTATGASVTADDADGPRGLDADKVAGNGVATDPNVSQQITEQVVNGDTVTFSVYAKPDTGDHFVLRVEDNSANAYARRFEWTAGVLADAGGVSGETGYEDTVVEAGVQEISGGWYRAYVTLTVAADRTDTVFEIYPEWNQSDGDAHHFWGAMVNRSAYRTYQATEDRIAQRIIDAIVEALRGSKKPGINVTQINDYRYTALGFVGSTKSSTAGFGTGKFSKKRA